MVCFSCPKPNFRFIMTSLRISGLENSFNWHHQTTSMLWMQFGVVWLLQSVLNNLMLLMKQWLNWEKILIRLVKFFSKIEILTGVGFEIRTSQAICQNLHEILHLRLKFKRNSYISLIGAISMIRFIFSAGRDGSPGALQLLQQRTWLLHWSLFIFFNGLARGKELLIELFLHNPDYTHAVQTMAPWLLR